MSLTNTLAEIPVGIYVLTANGELGAYNAQRQLQVDEPLTRAFAGHSRGFLHAYLNGAQANNQRVAILFEAREARVWGRTTLSLEESVVRDLYPTSGRAAGELTAFQQKSREQSVYRGMELLLDYRRENAPDVPVFCPVLFIPRVTLAERASALRQAPDESEREIPVIDVLNLTATIPVAQRAAPVVLALVEKLRGGVIRKDRRRDLQWSIQNATSPAQTPAANEGAPVQTERDKRTPATTSFPEVDKHRLHEAEQVESVERWLRLPHQPVSIERLRSFAPFRALDDARLAGLAARSLLYTAPAGTRLLERGLRDAWNLYLLDGTLTLMPADGTSLRVDAGADKATRAIASLKPRQYAVETMTPVSFLWVHDLLLEAVLGGTTRPAG